MGCEIANVWTVPLVDSVPFLSWLSPLKYMWQQWPWVWPVFCSWKCCAKNKLHSLVETLTSLSSMVMCSVTSPALTLTQNKKEKKKANYWNPLKTLFGLWTVISVGFSFSVIIGFKDSLYGGNLVSWKASLHMAGTGLGGLWKVLPAHPTPRFCGLCSPDAAILPCCPFMAPQDNAEFPVQPTGDQQHSMTVPDLYPG